MKDFGYKNIKEFNSLRRYKMFGITKDQVLEMCSEYFARTMKAWTSEVNVAKESYKTLSTSLTSQFNILEKACLKNFEELQDLVDKINASLKATDEWKKNWDSRLDKNFKLEEAYREDVRKSMADRAKFDDEKFKIYMELARQTRAHRKFMEDIASKQNDILFALTKAVADLKAKPVKAKKK